MNISMNVRGAILSVLSSILLLTALAGQDSDRQTYQTRLRTRRSHRKRTRLRYGSGSRRFQPRRDPANQPVFAR